MVESSSPSVEVSRDADAAYLRLRDAAVHRTVEFTPLILVYVDEVGAVVGLELLSLTVEAPLEDLQRAFQLDAATVEKLWGRRLHGR